MNRLHLRLFALVFALVMAIAACGGDDSDSEATTAAPAEATTTAAPEATTTAAPATTATAEALAPLQIWADDKFGPIIEEVAAPFTAETGVPIEVT
ncbi:MAG: hypothetical protein ABWY62_00460, partial [Acidimicrobiia bacterium]